MPHVIRIDIFPVVISKPFDFAHLLLREKILVGLFHPRAKHADMRHYYDVFLFRLWAFCDCIFEPWPGASREIVKFPALIILFSGIKIRAYKVTPLIIEGEILKIHTPNGNSSLLPAQNALRKIFILEFKHIIELFFASGINFVITYYGNI